MMTVLGIEDIEPPEDRRGSDRRAEENWLKKNATLGNILMVLMLFGYGGQYYERQQNSNATLRTEIDQLHLKIETLQKAQELAVDVQSGIYVRRDVLEERLRGMEAQLSDIKATLAKSNR